MSLFDFQKKTILVTGASSGIGRATAEVLAKLGTKVILVARNQNLLAEVKENLLGKDHIVAPFDLTKLEEINPWMSELSTRAGKLHGLVHCAGIHMLKPLRFLSSANIDDIMRLNVTAGLMLAQAFRQKQISAKPSAIVFLASVVAVVGQAGVLPYAASKGALVASMKSLAVELATENIRVNCVLPGIVKTSMSDKLFESMGVEQLEAIKKAHLFGFGEPEDVANAISFLLSDAAKWITGSTLVVDGGYTAM